MFDVDSLYDVAKGFAIMFSKCKSYDELRELLYCSKFIEVSTARSKYFGYGDSMFVPSESDIRRIEPMLNPIKSREDKYVWLNVRLSWCSLPHKPLVGRRKYYLIRDERTDKVLGIVAVTSDFLDLKSRDEYLKIHLNVRDVHKYINRHSLNCAVIVPAHPFNIVAGGKMMSMLLASSEGFERISKDFGMNLRSLTTTSLYGRSIQYERTKVWKYVGLSNSITVNTGLPYILQRAITEKYKQVDRKLLTGTPTWRLYKKMQVLKLPVTNKHLRRGVYVGLPIRSFYDDLLEAWKKLALRRYRKYSSMIYHFTKNFYEQQETIERFKNLCTHLNSTYKVICDALPSITISLPM